jgi:hypothetical protein
MEPPTQPSVTSLTILRALQSRNIYTGTVPAKVKDQRRASGKVARAARRQNRRGR